MLTMRSKVGFHTHNRGRNSDKGENPMILQDAVAQ